jgi:hypothetical protein
MVTNMTAKMELVATSEKRDQAISFATAPRRLRP